MQPLISIRGLSNRVTYQCLKQAIAGWFRPKKRGRGPWVGIRLPKLDIDHSKTASSLAKPLTKRPMLRGYRNRAMLLPVLLISPVVVPVPLVPVHGLVGRSGEVISAALRIELLAGDLDYAQVAGPSLLLGVHLP